MIQAVFTDIDGTLLQFDQTISYQNQNAIKKVIEKGIYVFLATGRSGKDTKKYYEILNLDTPSICMNGAYIIDISKKKILKEEIIPLELVIKIKKVLEGSPISITYYSQDLWVSQKKTPEIIRESKIVGFDIEIMSFEEIIKIWLDLNRGPNKIGILSNNEHQLLNAYKLLKRVFKENISIQKSQLNYMDITLPNISKKHGIEYLLKTYPNKFPFFRENIMAIGDNDNDIEMLNWSGIGVAMNNASDNVKKHAKIITLSNQEHGVMHVLNKYIINK